MGSLKEIQCLEGHTDRVWQVAWSPTGDMLASCGGDRTVRIWRRQPSSSQPQPHEQQAKQQQVGQQVEQQQQQQQQQPQPEGRWICSAILEDTHSRTIRSACWSPTGRYLATASFDRTTAIWQHQGGVWENVAMLEGHESEVKEVAWNPNGCLIATCSRDKTVWLWEAQPGNEYEVVDVKHGHSQDVKCVRWHPQGEVLASASYDDSIKLWVDEDDEWVCAQTLAGPGVGHTSTVWELAFDAEGRRMVSCSDDGTLKIWACRKEAGQLRWQLLSSLSGYHSRTIFTVDWSNSGLIASGCADNAIRIFGESAAADSAATVGEEAVAAAADAAAVEPGLRGLFMQQQQQQQQQAGEGGGSGINSAQRCNFSLLCKREQAHLLDVNCVRWHPADPLLLASAGDDCCVRLWRWHPFSSLNL